MTDIYSGLCECRHDCAPRGKRPDWKQLQDASRLCPGVRAALRRLARICAISFRLKIAQLFMAGLARGGTGSQGRKNVASNTIGSFTVAVIGVAPTQSGGGPPHSTTLRAVRRPSANAPAYWRAVARRRWQHASNGGAAGVTTTDGVVFIGRE